MGSEKNKGTNLVGETWGIPASVAWYGSYVVVGGRDLSRRLEELYLAGVRELEVVLDVPGLRLLVDGRVLCKRGGSRVYYYIYPKNPAQLLLREMYVRYRGNAERNAKKPMPAIVVAIMPREGV